MSDDLVYEKFNNQQKQLDGHEDRIKALEKTYSIMEKMDLRMSNVENSMKTINDKLNKQDEKKGMKWDRFVDYIFYAILGLLLSYIALKLGLK